jgi:hypothetical protein
MNRQPSVVKMITIDYASFMAFLFPVVSWGFYIIMLISKNITTTDYSLPAIIGVITIVAIGVLVWRLQILNTIFNDGIEAPATISNISFFRDRGRIDYIYTYQGQKYSRWNAVMKVKRTKVFQIGEPVTVMVDRNNPKRAFIRDLYI